MAVYPEGAGTGLHTGPRTVLRTRSLRRTGSGFDSRPGSGSGFRS